MATVVIYTEKGEQVWQSTILGGTIERLHCPGNTIGAEIARGIRQAVHEAESIESGRRVDRHHVRPVPGWNTASYTKKHIENLTYRGETIEYFSRSDPRAEGRARSRIMNAARKIKIKVSTKVEWEHLYGPRIVGTVVEDDS